MISGKSQINQVGSGGTMSNSKRRTDFSNAECEKQVKDSYENFLSESEIESVLMGVEIYLDAVEIRKRLQHREEMKSKKTPTEYSRPTRYPC